MLKSKPPGVGGVTGGSACCKAAAMSAGAVSVISSHISPEEQALESPSSRRLSLCQDTGCSQIQPCEAGSLFQQPPATGAFPGFLRFMLCLDTKEEQKHLRSPGSAPHTAASPLSPTAKTGWHNATASPLCPDRLPCPAHVAALDNPQNILPISSGKAHIKKGTPGHLIPT